MFGARTTTTAGALVVPNAFVTCVYAFTTGRLCGASDTPSSRVCMCSAGAAIASRSATAPTTVIFG